MHVGTEPERSGSHLLFLFLSLSLSLFSFVCAWWLEANMHVGTELEGLALTSAFSFSFFFLSLLNLYLKVRS